MYIEKITVYTIVQITANFKTNTITVLKSIFYKKGANIFSAIRLGRILQISCNSQILALFL